MREVTRLARTLVVGALTGALACGGAAAPAPAPAVSAGVPAPPEDGALRVADLGTCVLESGARIEGCKIGYRTFGKPNAARSNVVLFPTWFTGTTESLLGVVPGKLVDTSRFQLVLVDALGDGVSSSPSNSAAQPRLAFPRFSIRDMVESQRRLVTEVLGVRRLHAVAGISMGGMQAFEWAVSHPEMVERVVSIVGTPRLTSSDLLLWRAELHAIESDVAYRGGAYEARPELRAVLDIHHMALTTPAHRSRETTPEAFPAWIAELERDTSFDWNDWRRQLEAMMGHDVGRGRGGLEAAARRITAKALVVVAEQDHAVNPGPSKDLARVVGAELVTLEGDCGHAAPGCEEAKVVAAVRPHLAD